MLMSVCLLLTDGEAGAGGSLPADGGAVARDAGPGLREDPLRGPEQELDSRRLLVRLRPPEALSCEHITHSVQVAFRSAKPCILYSTLAGEFHNVKNNNTVLQLSMLSLHLRFNHFLKNSI